MTPISTGYNGEPRTFVRKRPTPYRLIYHVFSLLLLTFIYLSQTGFHRRVEAFAAHHSPLRHHHHHHHHHQHHHHHRQKRRSGFVGFSGAYCAKRPADRRCCAHRDDNCTAAIRVPTGRVRRVKNPTTDQLFISDIEMMDHLCYCDRFCDRTKAADGGGGNDCCPDYQEVCENAANDSDTLVVEHGSITLLTGEPQRRSKNIANGANGESQLSSNGEECLESGVAYGYGQTIKRNCQTWWTAHNYTNFWARTLDDGVRYRLGTLFPEKSVENMNEILIKRRELPLHFDARQKWPALAAWPTVDQGDCASSWAVSTTQVAADRLAILLDHDGPDTVGRRPTVPPLSAQQLLDCNAHKQRGCQGGFLDRAWWYIRKFGLVSEECYPYSSGVSRTTGQCQISKAALSGREGGSVSPPCANGISANNTVYKMTPPYRISVREEDIRTEIITNGPVQATFLVHDDFFMYKSGVYRHIEASKPSASGYHSVKILGWGEERSPTTGRTINYWICANSWGPQWGENGQFRIVRGENHCKIESFVIGAWAKHPSSNGGPSGRPAVERLVATPHPSYTKHLQYAAHSILTTPPPTTALPARRTMSTDDVWPVLLTTGEDSIAVTSETEKEQSTDSENMETITYVEETTPISKITKDYTSAITSEQPTTEVVDVESTAAEETEPTPSEKTTTEYTTTVAKEETTVAEEKTTEEITADMTTRAEEMTTVEMPTESADGELLSTTQMTMTVPDEDDESTTISTPEEEEEEEEGELTAEASTTPEEEDESEEHKQHNNGIEHNEELAPSASAPTTTVDEFSEASTTEETTTTEVYEDLEESEDDARLLEQSDDNELPTSSTKAATTYTDVSSGTTESPDSSETQEVELAETITVNLSFDDEVTTANPLVTTTVETTTTEPDSVETSSTFSTEESESLTETTAFEPPSSGAMINSSRLLTTANTDATTVMAVTVSLAVPPPLDRRMRRLRRNHRERQFRRRQLRWRLPGTFGRNWHFDNRTFFKKIGANCLYLL